MRVGLRRSRGGPFLDERRLGVLLGAFFVALAIPSAVLIAQAYGRLESEAFRQTQLLAEDLARRIDANLEAAALVEEARSFGDYGFLVVEGDAAANFVQRSVLSAFPVESAIPGAVGYFQIDASGELSTPLLPPAAIDAASFGLSAEEQRARRALEAQIREVLVENRLVPRSARDRDGGAEEGPASGGVAEEASTAGGVREERPTADRAVGEAFAAGSSPEEESDAGGTADESAALSGAARSAPSAAADGATRDPPTAAADGPPEAEGTTPEARRFDDLAAGGRSQAAFDRLKAGGESSRPLQSGAGADPVSVARRSFQERAASVALDADSAAPSTSATASEARQSRIEQALAPEPAAPPTDRGTATGASADVRVRMFESELEPFDLGLLDTGHLVLFRSAWRDGQRFIQGLLIDRKRFLARAAAAALAESSLAGSAVLAVMYGGETLGTFGGPAADGRPAAAGRVDPLLHRARLSPPFGNIELVFGVTRLPPAPGSGLIGWVTVILAVVLCGGFLSMYRFAVGQIRLTRQQQDFVSAVSHELKTPLTSIRMYGEMLKAGWADDSRRQLYYDYIHGEAERLSRLIENVLELARLTRNGSRFEPRRVTSAELLDIVRSKAGSQAERAGFRLELRNDAPAAELMIDADCFTQIVINLVDNALKFAADAELKTVEVACRLESDGRVLFTVRDFGPGIPKGQMKKVFELFYRTAGTPSRVTAGTGIGLALVRELAAAMDGRVEARNCSPGAELRVSFPACSPRPSA